MNHAAANEYPKKKTQSTNTYSLNGKRRIYSKFCIIYGVQFTMFFRCYFHRICCHFGTSTFYDITPPPLSTRPLISCLFILYVFYSYSIHIRERYVLFRFHLQSHLLAPCQAISCYCAIYTYIHTYIYIPYRIHTYMFIHIADDDSNQDNKNKYYTIFDCAAFWLNWEILAHI